MKYKNVLGKDFKTKPKAYKYLREKINEFETSTYTIMTEETPIKQSAMLQLDKDYGSWTDRSIAKTHSRGVDKWCVIYVKEPFPSLALGFIRNKKENGSKFHTELPECINAKKIFICFGSGTFNPNTNLEEALRHEIRPQIEEYREMYKNSHICAHCDHQFPPEELDVDHVYPFAKIKKEFLESYGKEFIMKCVYKERAVHRLDDWSPDDEVYPDSPREAWVRFHKERATYQMLCKNGKNGFPGCHPLKRMGRKIESKAFPGNKSPKM